MAGGRRRAKPQDDEGRSLMLQKVLRAKIHRATVTQAKVDYVGSITIDQDLIDAAGLAKGECVLVADMTDGARFETYVMSGERGSGIICINGAAARLVDVGDQVIIMAFGYVEPDEAQTLKPSIVIVDDRNKVSSIL
jgi:aspartate 1-decarboxylase